MPLPTVTLTVRAAGQTGAPMADVAVSAILDRTDTDPDHGYVAPVAATATTDGTGTATLALWPNSRGTEGSLYRVTLTDSAGTELLRATVVLPETDTNLADVASELAVTPAAWPAVDNGRRDRLKADILDMLHQSPENTAYADRVERWMDLLVRDLTHHKLWFWRRVAGSTLEAGQDIVDLSGDIARIETLWLDGRELPRVTLGTLLGFRGEAPAKCARATCCALEAGFRVHLYPAPAAACTFSVLYRRPADIALLPDEFEELIMAGVIGRYARHFDRGALATEPVEWLLRYRELLARALAGDSDMPVNVDAQPWLYRGPGGAQAGELAAGTASAGEAPVGAYAVPASMGGSVGYASVECGVYPISVY